MKGGKFSRFIYTTYWAALHLTDSATHSYRVVQKITTPRGYNLKGFTEAWLYGASRTHD
jgi:hypothetical protein